MQIFIRSFFNPWLQVNDVRISLVNYPSEIQTMEEYYGLYRIRLMGLRFTWKQLTWIVESAKRSTEYAVPYQGSVKSVFPSNLVDSQKILQDINNETEQQANGGNQQKVLPLLSIP